MMDFDDRYTHYQLQRSGLRKLVRRLYLQSALQQLHGPTVDFGCGVGELLARLPAGSVGLEINPASVAHCVARGLDARLYDASGDDWALRLLDGTPGLRSLIVSHVLEHLDDPAGVLRKLLAASRRLGITRVLAIVPGRRGFALDSTHRRFVDLPLLADPRIVLGIGFRLQRARYFPGNLRRLGDLFPHHELQVLFRRD